MSAKLSQKAIRELIDNYLLADVELKKIEKYKEKLKADLIALGEGAHLGNAGQVSATVKARLIGFRLEFGHVQSTTVVHQVLHTSTSIVLSSAGTRL